MSAIRSCDSLLNLLILRLAQVLKEGFLVLVALELFDQLLDLDLAICIEKEYAWNSVVNGFV